MKIKKQYGLWTGIAMVVGIVIGSGVFVKAEKVLTVSGGDLKLSLLAWLVGGLIMVASGFCFAVYASKVQKYNGVVDYVEKATNKRVGYHLAWIFTTFYYPIIAAIVAILAAQNFFAMFGLALEMNDIRIYIFALKFGCRGSTNKKSPTTRYRYSRIYPYCVFLFYTPITPNEALIVKYEVITLRSKAT